MQIIIINRQKKIPITKRAIKAAVLKTFKFLKVNPVRPICPIGRIKNRSNGVDLAGQLTILYTDNRTIQELNYRFLGKDQPTDVLCFDLSFGKKVIADIAISTEKAFENSRIFKTSPLWEVKLYLIHGILHLFGYSDRKRKDRIQMQRKALQILKSSK